MDRQREMLYCIEHERMVRVELPVLCPSEGHLTEEIVQIYEGATVKEIDYCCFDGGWATCPPPPDPFVSFETFMSYIQSVNEPSDEELKQSDENADSFWFAEVYA